MGFKRVDENSKQTYTRLKRLLSDRKKVILHEFLMSGKMTDRQCKERLRFDDMNKVRPRISDLLEDGFLVRLVEKVKDHETHEMVRQCRAASVPEFMAKRDSSKPRQQEMPFF